MTAPGQNQFAAHQGQPTFQQNQGQPRQAQGQQSSQNGQQQKPAQAAADPKLAQFTFRKPPKSNGKGPSWLDIEPKQMCVSLEALQLDSNRMNDEMRKKGHTIQSMQNKLPDNALTQVQELIKSQNLELQKINPKLEWKMDGIDLEYKIYHNTFTSDHRVLRRFDVVLKTQTRPGAQNAAAKGNAGQTNNAQGQNAKNNPNQAFDSNPQGLRGGPPPPPPPPPPPNMGGGAQNMNASQMMGGPPPPPPPPYSGPQNSQQPHFQEQAMGHPGNFPNAPPYPSMRHEPPHFPHGIEFVDPRVLKKQKSKPKSKMPPGGFPDDSGSDMSIDSEASDSMSAISIDEPGYASISGRSRSRGRRKDKHRSHSRPRSRSRDAFRHHKERSSRNVRQSGVDIGKPPLGQHGGGTHNQSPRSSDATVKPSPVEIHIHQGSVDAKKKSERENDRGRSSKTWERDHPDLHHDPRRSAYDISPQHSPRHSFHREDKFPPSVPMSSHSSTSRDSDTYYSDGDSSIASDGSVFSAPMPPTRKSGRGRYESDHFIREYHTESRRPGFQHSYNDYPHEPHQRARADHSRSQAQRVDMDHDDHVETHYDRHGNIKKIVRHGGPTRRHSVQVEQQAYPRPPFSPQRTMSYAEANPEVPYNYFPQPKAQPNTQRQYFDDGKQQPLNLHSIVAATARATANAMRQQEASAMEHIHDSQRQTPLRKKTFGSRARHDNWAHDSFPVEEVTARHRNRGSMYGRDAMYDHDY